RPLRRSPGGGADLMAVSRAQGVGGPPALHVGLPGAERRAELRRPPCRRLPGRNAAGGARRRRHALVMSIEAELNEALKEAMRRKDADLVATIRAVRAKVQ